MLLLLHGWVSAGKRQTQSLHVIRAMKWLGWWFMVYFFPSYFLYRLLFHCVDDDDVAVAATITTTTMTMRRRATSYARSLLLGLGSRHGRHCRCRCHLYTYSIQFCAFFIAHMCMPCLASHTHCIPCQWCAVTAINLSKPFLYDSNVCSNGMFLFRIIMYI